MLNLSDAFSREIYQKIQARMDHIAFRAFTLVMIIVDLIVIIVDLANGGDRHALEIISLIIVLYFFIEVHVRLIVKG